MSFLTRWFARLGSVALAAVVGLVATSPAAWAATGDLAARRPRLGRVGGVGTLCCLIVVVLIVVLVVLMMRRRQPPRR